MASYGSDEERETNRKTSYAHASQPNRSTSPIPPNSDDNSKLRIVQFSQETALSKSIRRKAKSEGKTIQHNYHVLPHNVVQNLNEVAFDNQLLNIIYKKIIDLSDVNQIDRRVLVTLLSQIGQPVLFLPMMTIGSYVVFNSAKKCLST